MGDPKPHLEIERSKVKVTRPLNAVTENQPYLRNRRPASHHWQEAVAYCSGHAQRQASPHDHYTVAKVPPDPKIECNRLLPDGVTDSAWCMGLCAHCMCRSTVSMRTVCKWLKRKNCHLVTQIWITWRYHAWGAIYEAILKPLSEAQNSFWIKKSHWRKLSADPVNRAVPSFRNSFTGY